MSENKQVQLELDLGERLDAAKVHAPKKARLPPEEMDRLRLFLERESRDFKMEDALLALVRAGELAEP